MKIEKLNENKIRVILNIDDLAERDIDYHSFMSNSIESQSIFLDMLHKAEKEVGFRTDDCRIMIEALALHDGTFVFTITKCARTDNSFKPKDTNKKQKSLHIKRKTPMPENSRLIYCFDSFDTFCEFCSYIKNSSLKNELEELSHFSSLFEYKSNYYLILRKLNSNSKIANFICSSLSEFSHFIENPELFERKLIEHGKVIMVKNAILTCIENFV
ncbi:MAG: adaptor protein MecA [Clostridia bacterium]|nr:adaptor protein MecA [Clostridia bacterium]